MADPSGGAAAQSTAEQPAPPHTSRRPRVREVSSRFMSPLVQLNSTPTATTNPSDLPRSKSVRRRQSRTNENQTPEWNRSFDKSSATVVSTTKRKPHEQRGKQRTKENAEPEGHQNSDSRVLSRPDTPISMGRDRIVPSRYRQVPNTVHRSNRLNNSSDGCTPVTAAARLLQEATSDMESKLSRISTSSRDDRNNGSSSCPNSPLCVPSTKLRSVPDTRSSMPDADKWRAERNFSNSGKGTSDCARSLNFTSSMNMGAGISLPPHPSTCTRSGLDVKKGRKASNHQEDVHSLKMSSNHYLQWRFANAKAEASIRAQKQEAERKIYSLGCKISDIRDNVKAKRNEVAALGGIKALTTVVKAQMPYLDEWATLEEDYSTSLLGTTNALVNSSVRLPVNGEVRADVGELREALRSALKVVELVGSHIQGFMRKAEEMDFSLSEIAKMASGERALIEECGDLLSKSYASQVQECSLRGTLIQYCKSNQHQNQKS